MKRLTLMAMVVVVFSVPGLPVAPAQGVMMFQKGMDFLDQPVRLSQIDHP